MISDMKILVDKVPDRCGSCLFCQTIRKPSLIGADFVMGCTLLNLQIDLASAQTTKFGNCPLKESR